MKRIEIVNNFWRESGRSLRLFVFSAHVAVPLLLFMLHIRTWTFVLLVVTVVTMMVIERLGFTVPVAMLALRAKIAGPLVKRRRSLFAKRLDR